MSETESSPERRIEPRRSGAASADDARREKIQKQLDDALAASFPASDPVAIVTSHQEEDWGAPEGEG